MIEIAIMGYGVVGSGVAEVCNMNQAAIHRRTGRDIHIKKILDLRKFPGDPFESCITHKVEDILEDPDISVVVETIGGASFALDMTRKALQAGKHVVTSNKELVAKHGPELMELAMQKKVSYLFEASVGGGIPIIRPLHKCLAANVIQQISGILNGTTNYILTRMEQAGLSFAEALREAQEKGYAEQNPAADLEGTDACRKIAILSSVAFGEYIDSMKIHTEGITAITTRDMDYARHLACKIKLLGSMHLTADNQADIIVAPMLIPAAYPVAVADDVFNAILVQGNALGEAMFYGRGAGRLPTASAVVADIIECVMHLDRIPHVALWERTARNLIKPHAQCPVKVLLRFKEQVDRRILHNLLGPYGLEQIQFVVAGETAYLAGGTGGRQILTEGILSDALDQVAQDLINRIRVYTG